MRIITLFIFLNVFSLNFVDAQSICYDLAHGEGAPGKPLMEIAENLGLKITQNQNPISEEGLATHQLLYLRGPGSKISETEKIAIINFVKNGGSLLVIQDEEHRQKLEVTEVNDIIIPFGMMLTGDTPYIHNQGAKGVKSDVLGADYEIPYSGGRAVAGGTPFVCRLDENGEKEVPVACFKVLESGARIIVMGEVMAAIFLGTEEGVRLTGEPRNPRKTTYFGKDSYKFMNDMISWLCE